MAEQAGAAVVDDPEPRPAVYESITALLRSVGIEQYDRNVVDMLIDFVYSYSKGVLKDAQAYAEAAGTPATSISVQDVELAIRGNTFAQPFSLEMLASAAAPINKQDLPSIQDRPGLSVPTKGTLLSANVQFMADNDGDTGAAEDAGIDGAAFQPMQMDLSELPGAGLGKPDDQDADAMDTNQMLPEPL